MVFTRVFSTVLSPLKNWYAVNTALCGGLTRYFVNSSLAKRFPEEIMKISFDCVYLENGAKCSPKHFDGGRTKEEVYVATPFAIIFGILNQKNNTIIDTKEFQNLINLVNSFELPCVESSSLNDSKQSLGEIEEQLKRQAEEIASLRKQLHLSKSAISAKLRTSTVKEYLGSRGKASSSLGSLSPAKSNSSVDAVEISPNLADIKLNQNLRPLHKRKKRQ